MSADTTKNIQARIDEGDLYKTMGLFNEARIVYSHVLADLGPSDLELREKVEVSLKDLPTEINQVTKDTNKSDFQDDWQNCLGLMEAGFFAEALVQLNKLGKAKSADVSINCKKAECYQKLDQPLEAINNYKEAISFPGMEDREKQLPVLDQLVNCYEIIGDIPAAIKALDEIIEINPDFNNASKHRERLTGFIRQGERFAGLLRNGKISLEELESAITTANRKKQSIETVLLAEFNIKKNDLGALLSEYYSCPFITFGEQRVETPPRCLEWIQPHHLHDNLFVPIDDSGPETVVATVNPGDETKSDIIRTILKTGKIKLAVALKEDILQFIEYFNSMEEANRSQDDDDLFDNLELVDDSTEIADDVLEEEYVVGDDVVVRIAYKIINDAINNKASDIHIENKPGKRGILIRLRVDGDCLDYRTIPFQYKRYLISRFKVMAKLDITEKRLPQDGKIKFKDKDGKITELRVATIPTVGNNEDIVLRVLASGGSLPLDKMNFTPDNFKRFKEMLSAPYGLIPVVGPTSSGKTTSLHAALGYLKCPEKKILTVEDPVEILQDGIRQVQVNNKIGMDFPNALRAFLRADPDIIMVGETRDKETADIVIEAALTGHLVFTTLHTNSAPETMTRLLGLGVEPQSFADSLLGILAQRLVKRVCPQCRQPYQPDDEEKDLLLQMYGNHPLNPLKAENLENVTLYQGKGCTACNNLGFKGRLAVHEVLLSNLKIREAINNELSVLDIQRLAMEAGMHTLMQDGIRKILAGETGLSQVRAVCK